ncbi:unnamed protein product [Candidula unifasciata]|uniref:RRM domain-containing protein n=1 Tax=Candidula unifasciata TaxID=100452 RepID=A0A8S3ZIC0_9EUPU|nr:unnamed protein product [Candidula unifasciata]
MENSEDQVTTAGEEIAENQTEDTEETSTEAVNNEGVAESGLLESDEPMEEGAQLNDSLLEETEAQNSAAEHPSGEVEGNEAVLEDTMDDGKEGEEKEEDEDKEEEIKLPDTEMPQVNVASLAKRKWQVKIYPLKPDDFINGQIARVFSNAKESLLYIYSSGKFNGGKGEMYVSSEVQAAKVVHNLMKLDFKSQNINIEIIRKNNEGVVEEKAFMRFDTKLIRILCIPAFKNRRLGGRRDRVVGSVFLKNLPNGTSKDMLRVMFPFAPEINYSPDKFPDGTARLVLGARSSVGPCLRGFTKLELGDTLLELKPLQKRAAEDEKKKDAGETDGTKKAEGSEEAGSQPEADDKAVDGKTDEKSSAEKTSGKSPAKSPAASKAADGKEKKPGVGNKTPQSLGANKNRNPRDNRRDTGARRGTYRPRRGNFAQRGGDRNRFRTGGFGSRFRPEDRRMRMPGAGRDAGINTGAAKEMMLLQSQLSVAIKNQLSMLNQTQFALEQAKREAATVSFSRDVAQASPSSLMSRRVSSTPRTEQQARGGQVKTNNRRQQHRRGKPRDRRTEGGRFGEGARFGGGGDYSYKRNAEMAGLPEEYGATGQGKRRTSGFGEHSESHSWADDRAAPAFGSSYPPAFGYEREFEEREADFHSLHAGLSPRSLNYSHNSNYGYRY